MAKTIQELFHAKSLRELFEGTPPRDEITIREAATAELEIREGSHPDHIELLARAWVPGDGDPEDHPLNELLEAVAPSHGEIQRQMEHMREVHRRADANPEQGAVHLGWQPTEDMGGITQPADPRNLIGPFVPVPPDEVPPPMTGGFKMKIQSFDEYVAESRALREEDGAQGSRRAPCAASATGPVIGKARGFPVVRGD